MKLYFFDETEWVAANSEEEAVKFYMEETGTDEIEMKDVDFKEVPKRDWKTKTIVLDEYEEGSEDPISMPFDEYLKQFSDSELPLFVASTEC